jgi:hypothetical protein
MRRSSWPGGLKKEISSGSNWLECSPGLVRRAEVAVGGGNLMVAGAGVAVGDGRSRSQALGSQSVAVRSQSQAAGRGCHDEHGGQ